MLSPLSTWPSCLLPLLQRVPTILREVVAKEGLGGLPIFALGGSSGGSFVLRLANHMAEVKVGAAPPCRMPHLSRVRSLSFQTISPPVCLHVCACQLLFTVGCCGPDHARQRGAAGGGRGTHLPPRLVCAHGAARP